MEEEDVDGIVQPEDFQALARQRSVLDVGARCVRLLAGGRLTHVRVLVRHGPPLALLDEVHEIGGPIVERDGVVIRALAGAGNDRLVIARQQSAWSVVDHAMRLEVRLEEGAGRRRVRCGRRAGRGEKPGRRRG